VDPLQPHRARASAQATAQRRTVKFMILDSTSVNSAGPPRVPQHMANEADA
jgi:hypothetical protein